MYYESNLRHGLGPGGVYRLSPMARGFWDGYTGQPDILFDDMDTDFVRSSGVSLQFPIVSTRLFIVSNPNPAWQEWYPGLSYR